MFANQEILCTSLRGNMGLRGLLTALLSLAAAVAEIEIETVSEHFVYGRSTSGSEKTLDILSVNSVPFLAYDHEARAFSINGQATDGREELGEEEVTYFVQRAEGFQNQIRSDMSELAAGNDNQPIGSKKPIAHIYTEEDYVLQRANTLYCFAERFYPFEIELQFLVNGQPFTGPVHSSPLLVERDWTFNILKYIRIEPQRGDTFSCLVAHVSLDKALTLSLDRPTRTPISGIVVCVVGVLVGVLGLMLTLYLGREIHKRNVAEIPVHKIMKIEGLKKENPK
ncbi:rano class II histocompatibility antigen, A beta chain-like [Leucoraja erinacea]|uniref:rano class II histocompatibility antigen, A beta chain-like n=1 Tax=Leucoraja erinaceus TaxID=7782 RepID=UPI00245534C7|nr:rano class II histocompatibility antigen, A beta chain-like [Leucoraja erinacea]